MFSLEVTNVYGTDAYTIGMYVLIGDVDNNNIVNMLDMYTTAIHYGQTEPPCWRAEDLDNDGIVSMLDLYFCALSFGRTC
jgi:hypothetical protein